MEKKTYDRHAKDSGNIVGLEHCNVRVPDQQIATAFYVVGMGFTRDPYIMVGLENMWINIGQQQIHMPTGGPQRFPGWIGMVVPDLEALVARLTAIKGKLSGTVFDFSVDGQHVLVTCPWGNRLRCHAPGQFGDITLGIPYVEFPVDPGTAAGIARFYEKVLGAPATVTGGVARVGVGWNQSLVFRETAEERPPYDGHHIAVYITDFSGPHRKLQEMGLITEESSEIQYRFVTIADPDGGKRLFDIEHEVRCYTHPMFLRPLINRNPAQRQATYVRGRDFFVPGVV